jgi:hypothetical protein
MRLLEQKGVVHRDLAARNVLVRGESVERGRGGEGENGWRARGDGEGKREEKECTLTYN